MEMGVADMEVALTISAPQFSSWSILALLLLLTTSYQILALKITDHPSDHAQLFFFAAGMLLLPPSLFALLVLLAYLGRWGKGWWTTPWLPRDALNSHEWQPTSWLALLHTLCETSSVPG